MVARFIVLFTTIFYCAALRPIDASAQAVNSRLALKASFKGMKYCAFVKNKWQPASAINAKKGKATLVKSPNAKAKKYCKRRGTKFGSTAITFSTGSSSDRARGKNVSAAAATSFLRVSSTGETAALSFLSGFTVDAFLELPNRRFIVIPTTAPVTIAGQSCDYGIVSSRGELTCLRTVTYFELTDGNGSPDGGRAIQFDSSGNAYFIGSDESSMAGENASGQNYATSLFKLSTSGVLAEYWSAPASTRISSFSVKSDGTIALSTVLVAESTDIPTSLILISSSGVASTLSSDTRTISGASIGFVHFFPDGKPYAGLSNFGGPTPLDESTAYIVRLAGDGVTLENYMSVAAANPVGLSTDSFCAGSPTALEPFCASGGTLLNSGHATSTAFLGVVRSQNIALNTNFVQYFPTLSAISLTNLTRVSYVGGQGDIVLVGGQNGTVATILQYNPATTAETVLSTSFLLGGSGFLYSSASSSFIGYGIRTSDMVPAAIQIPVSGGIVGSPVVTQFPSVLSTVTVSY